MSDFDWVISGVVGFIMWELWSINRHLQMAIPPIISRLKYLEDLQTPHRYNKIQEQPNAD